MSEKDTKPLAKALPLATLGALGVVYGDLGTSPLYTFRAISASLGGSIDSKTALGSLSLIVWTLLITISLKYCLLVMRADNRGEGGILALMSLVGASRFRGKRAALTIAALAGAAFIYGDGVITPSISVLSALEGVSVSTQALTPYVLPTAVVVLLGLFGVQQFGTGRIGFAFGPIMLVWFAIIACLGVKSIIAHPDVLVAINPVHAVAFFRHHGLAGFIALGSVFLCATGGEALYADMGHFGRVPIRVAWYGLVLPALVLNYAGQVAGLMSGDGKSQNPFFDLAPAWGVGALVVLATVATIIASQAIIAGVFSLTRQAIQLGWFPGLTTLQTSETSYGQIYIPIVNWLMMVATIILTLTFKSSTALAGAYGIAVSATMLVTTLLLIRAMRCLWQWSWTTTIATGGVFFLVDLAFFGANLFKLPDGGWIPLGIGVIVFLLMTTWREGIDAVHRRLARAGESDSTFLSLLQHHRVPRVPGTAVFLTRPQRGVPALMMQHLRHMGALQETIVELTVHFVDRPYVAAHDRAHGTCVGSGFWRVRVRFGYMEDPDLLKALTVLKGLDTCIDFRKVVYFGARDLVVHDSAHPRLPRWRLAIFAFLFRNSAKTMERFSIPRGQFVELAREVAI